jgi:hypothetical protein
MKMLVIICSLVFSALASAQTRIISVDAFELGYSGGLSFRHDDARSGPDRDTTTFRLNLNYAQNFEQYVGLMWKGQINFNRTEVDFGQADAIESTFGGAGGVLYNFQPEDVKNSFMASALVGIERATIELPGADDESGFNLYFILEAGKRWDLGQYAVANISYAPTIALIGKRYGGDIRDEYFRTGRDIRFNFLKFDILF